MAPGPPYPRAMQRRGEAIVLGAGIRPRNSHPAPMFASPRAELSWAEVVFAGWAGLRGSVSLIMIADFLTHR